MKKYNFAIVTFVSTLTGACAMGTTSKDSFAVANVEETAADQGSSTQSTVSTSSSSTSGVGGSADRDPSSTSGAGGADGSVNEENLGGAGGAETEQPETGNNSSAGGAEEPPPPPPPPQPLSGCVDESDMLGEVFWSRNDIVFCGTADKQLPANLTAAKAMCAPGWHLCSHQEFADRNDLCPAHQENFSAILDDGEDCMMHDSGDTCPDCWKCNDDFVRPGYAGSCQGAQSLTGFSTRGRVQDSSGPASHGALCCL